MTDKHLKHAIGIFSNRQDAEQALVELQDQGFPMHKISVITKTSDEDGLYRRGIQPPSMTRTEGATAGAIAGSTGVGLLTLVVGLGLLLVPGVGPALAVESFLTAILGSGTAAAVGGAYGALQGWLVPEEQAKIYNDRFNQGDYLVIVEAVEDEIQMAEPILKRWEIRSWRIFTA